FSDLPQVLQDQWRAVGRGLNTMAPPEPEAGTNEYERWLDHSTHLDEKIAENVYFFIKKLPPYAKRKSNSKVSPSLVLEPTAALVADIIVGCRKIPWLMEILERNMPRASNGKLIWPEDYDGDLMRYLRNTPFRKLFMVELPFDVPKEQRFA